MQILLIIYCVNCVAKWPGGRTEAPPPWLRAEEEPLEERPPAGIAWHVKHAKLGNNTELSAYKALLSCI